MLFGAVTLLLAFFGGFCSALPQSDVEAAGSSPWLSQPANSTITALLPSAVLAALGGPPTAPLELGMTHSEPLTRREEWWHQRSGPLMPAPKPDDLQFEFIACYRTYREWPFPHWTSDDYQTCVAHRNQCKYFKGALTFGEITQTIRRIDCVIGTCGLEDHVRLCQHRKDNKPQSNHCDKPFGVPVENGMCLYQFHGHTQLDYIKISAQKYDQDVVSGPEVDPHPDVNRPPP
jgi:hypothetical protein